MIDPFSHRTGAGCSATNRPRARKSSTSWARSKKTGKWIVYTSGDSVFQIAAHTDTIPLEELYAACEAARELLTGKHAVGRVIARPFVGEPGNYTRGLPTATTGH